MCACKETDVRESVNDCTFTSEEGHGSRGVTCHVTFDESPISSLVVHPVVAFHHSLPTNFKNGNVLYFVVHSPLLEN
jgi:hypothetical protein